MDISDGEYTFERNNDNISTISFGDNPIMFTSVENMNFECNDNSKIVHIRKKVNGSENPNTLIDNLLVFKIFLKCEHHNFNTLKILTIAFMEVSVPNNYPDYKSSVEYGLTENFTWNTTGTPILVGMSRDLGRNSNLSYLRYGRCGTRQQNLAAIYGYDIAKQISNKEYDTLLNYLIDIHKVTKDENGNIIIKKYFETTENDVELIEYGHYVAIVNPDKQPDGFKDVIIGVISMRSFVYQNINKVKDFFQAVIKFFNSRNVIRVIFDVSFNPGGYITNSYATMTSTTKTDYNWKSLAGVVGNADNTTTYIGNDDVVNYFNSSVSEDKKNNFINAGFNLELAEKYTYTDEDGNIYEKSSGYEEELNAVVFFIFLNNASFSGAQFLTNMFRSKSKFTVQRIIIGGGTSSIFGTAGVNEFNLDTFNEGTIQFSMRWESFALVCGKNQTAIDDSSNYYNRVDRKFNVDNEQYLADFNVNEDGVKDNDKDHASSEMEFMIRTVLETNNE